MPLDLINNDVSNSAAELKLRTTEYTKTKISSDLFVLVAWLLLSENETLTSFSLALLCRRIFMSSNTRPSC